MEEMLMSDITGINIAHFISVTLLEAPFHTVHIQQKTLALTKP